MISVEFGRNDDSKIAVSCLGKTFMSTVVSLVGDLGLREASEVRGRLLAALSAGVAVVVDARGLAGADLAIVQLLVAAHKSAARQGVPLRLLAGANGALRAAEGAFWLGDAA
jgi:anti-anti-sigma regulatory factor